MHLIKMAHVRSMKKRPLVFVVGYFRGPHPTSYIWGIFHKPRNKRLPIRFQVEAMVSYAWDLIKKQASLGLVDEGKSAKVKK